MSLSNLPTLADLDRVRRATPKHEMTSRLTEKAESRKVEKKQERFWREAIWERDKGKCRWCRRQVVKSLALIPERGECHHITPREHRPTRWDARNGVLLCASDHMRITGAVGGEKATIIAGRTFSIDGREYPDASGPLNFKVL